MVAFKSPERELKGLLIIVRERIKHVSGINLLGTTFKKIALVQTFKNTITPHTYKLKSLSTLPIINVIFVDVCKYIFLYIYFTLKQVKHNSRTLCRSRLRRIGHRCLEPAATPKYEPLDSCITVFIV